MDRNIRPINCSDLYLAITFMCHLPALLSALFQNICNLSTSTSVFDLEIEKFGKYLQRNMEKYSKYSNIELKLE